MSKLFKIGDKVVLKPTLNRPWTPNYQGVLTVEEYKTPFGKKIVVFNTKYKPQHVYAVDDYFELAKGIYLGGE